MSQIQYIHSKSGVIVCEIFENKICFDKNTTHCHVILTATDIYLPWVYVKLYQDFVSQQSSQSSHLNWKLRTPRITSDARYTKAVIKKSTQFIIHLHLFSENVIYLFIFFMFTIWQENCVDSFEICCIVIPQFIPPSGAMLDHWVQPESWTQAFLGQSTNDHNPRNNKKWNLACTKFFSNSICYKLHDVWVVTCNATCKIRFYVQHFPDPNQWHLIVWYFAWVIWIYERCLNDH